MFTITRRMTKPRVQLAWEMLPATNGSLHAVNPDPRAFIQDFPSSLCGVMLVSQGGKINNSDPCVACSDEMHVRQTQFDFETGQ